MFISERKAYWLYRWFDSAFQFLPAFGNEFAEGFKLFIQILHWIFFTFWTEA